MLSVWIAILSLCFDGGLDPSTQRTRKTTLLHSHGIVLSHPKCGGLYLVKKSFITPAFWFPSKSKCLHCQLLTRVISSVLGLTLHQISHFWRWRVYSDSTQWYNQEHKPEEFTVTEYKISVALFDEKSLFCNGKDQRQIILMCGDFIIILELDSSLLLYLLFLMRCLHVPINLKTSSPTVQKRPAINSILSGLFW